MKPLFTITVVAPGLQEGICAIFEQTNVCFKDEEVRYVETLSQPLMEKPSIGYPQGRMAINVCMVFEAENLEEIARLNKLLMGKGGQQIGVY